VVGLGGCGTAVFHHTVEVVLQDPSGRLGGGPVPVSVFDHLMGYSEEWARRSIGPASSARPYRATVSSTAAKTIFDSSPPDRVEVGLAIPSLEGRGYFLVTLQPKLAPEAIVQASYCRYDAYFPDAGAPTLPVRYQATPSADGWRLRLIPQIPAR
jgi:hypothetical protein